MKYFIDVGTVLGYPPRIVIKPFDVISTVPGVGIPRVIDLSAHLPRAAGLTTPSAAAATASSSPSTPSPVAQREVRGGIRIVRSAHNPIVVPGGHEWRRAVTFNPGVVLHDDGRFY